MTNREVAIMLISVLFGIGTVGLHILYYYTEYMVSRLKGQSPPKGQLNVIFLTSIIFVTMIWIGLQYFAGTVDHRPVREIPIQWVGMMLIIIVTHILFHKAIRHK